MHSILFSLLRLGIPLLIILCFCQITKRCSLKVSSDKDTLDRIGRWTNILLAFFYLPFSIQSIFAGGIYIADGTALQHFMCQFYSLLMAQTPLIAYGGLVTSWKLRDSGQSLPSFLFQLLGLFYPMILLPIPDLILRIT